MTFSHPDPLDRAAERDLRDDPELAELDALFRDGFMDWQAYIAAYTLWRERHHLPPLRGGTLAGCKP